VHLEVEAWPEGPWSLALRWNDTRPGATLCCASGLAQTDLFEALRLRPPVLTAPVVGSDPRGLYVDARYEHPLPTGVVTEVVHAYLGNVTTEEGPGPRQFRLPVPVGAGAARAKVSHGFSVTSAEERVFAGTVEASWELDLRSVAGCLEWRVVEATLLSATRQADLPSGHGEQCPGGGSDQRGAPALSVIAAGCIVAGLAGFRRAAWRGRP
ncbi:MAG TPA: hypothetical protein VI997_02525, partial [Candidatus Thermoplasmatota archaeon]|nr:hypothetical protein [Candidatus Thermoplasmatota archaeon]